MSIGAYYKDMNKRMGGVVLVLGLGAVAWVTACTPKGLAERGANRSSEGVSERVGTAQRGTGSRNLSALLAAQAEREAHGEQEVERMSKSNDEWREELSDLAYHVTREHGTERAFTGELLNEKRKGHFTAVGGTLPLFSSDTKFDSGTGWPSFFDIVDEKNVTLHEDTTLGMRRVEVRCAQTGHHLGHVFEDGPNPTGLRYCINSAAIQFVPDEE